MVVRLNSRGFEVPQYIRDRKPFRTHGALSARAVENRWQVGEGMLRGPDLAQFSEDRSSIDYVVLSYSTPIAWHTRDGRWHRVTQKFSMTTSHHQGRLYLIPA